MRERILAVLLALAAALLVAGVAGFSGRVALIVAGLLVAAWSWLLLGEVE